MVPGLVNAVTITPPPTVPGAAAPRRSGMIRRCEHRHPPASRWHPGRGGTLSAALEQKLSPPEAADQEERREEDRQFHAAALPAAATRHDRVLVVNRPGGGTHRR